MSPVPDVSSNSNVCDVFAIHIFLSHVIEKYNYEKSQTARITLMNRNQRNLSLNLQQEIGRCLK